jgi:hypothetical protein
MNDAQIWSWIVTIVGVIGWWFVGKKYWWSWFIGLFCQILWFIYATVSSQPAFYISVLLYTAVYGKNAIAWTGEHFRKKARRDDSAELFKKPGFLVPNNDWISHPFGTYEPRLEPHPGIADVYMRDPFFTFEERQRTPEFIPTEAELWQRAIDRWGDLRKLVKSEPVRRQFDKHTRDIIRNEYGF